MHQISEKDLKEFKKLHFIGVGGSGMFPLVQILLSQGHTITGSDNNPGETIEQEREMGVEITIGHNAQNVGDAQAIIFSAAISKDNPELLEGERLGIPLIERSELLGLITRRYENCICVAGTHGKTTTTAMLTQVMLGCNLDPSAVIGGKLKAIGGSGRAGNTENMVVEACEYVDTFLHLSPDIAVILNVDADHLEYFKTIENIIRSFHKFASLATKTVIYNGDDPNSVKAVQGLTTKLVSFGEGEQNEYCYKNIVWLDGSHGLFDLYHNGEKLVSLTINVPGVHNLINATAAAVATLESGGEPELLAKGLAEFTGAHRRFEVLGKINGVTVADDYAHHPAEIVVTLNAAKLQGYNEVWAVFQPYTFSRTSLLLEDFAKSLCLADHVVMSAIMGGRECNTYGITTEDLAKQIPNSVWFETFEEIKEYVLARAKPNDLVITLGCGDVYKCANMMLK